MLTLEHFHKQIEAAKKRNNKFPEKLFALFYVPDKSTAEETRYQIIVVNPKFFHLYDYMAEFTDDKFFPHIKESNNYSY